MGEQEQKKLTWVSLVEEKDIYFLFRRRTAENVEKENENYLVLLSFVVFWRWWESSYQVIIMLFLFSQICLGSLLHIQFGCFFFLKNTKLYILYKLWTIISISSSASVITLFPRKKMYNTKKWKYVCGRRSQIRATLLLFFLLFNMEMN